MSIRYLIKTLSYYSNAASSKVTPPNTTKSPISNVLKVLKDNKHLWWLIIPATTFGLGTWQVLRLQWKLQQVEELEKRTTLPAIKMPSDILQRLEELNYRRVSLTGYFDHSCEAHMWPRNQLVTIPTHDSSTESGAQIITPFYCYETESVILVNRGWVPHTRMNPAMRPHGQIDGDVTLNGLIRIQDKKPIFSQKNDITGNKWSWRDVAKMALHLGTEPVFVDADSSSTVRGGPIGGQTRVTIPNDNLQYIVTWHGMSIATFYVIWRFWKKGK